MIVKWTNAKTYADAPHEYFIRQDNPEMFTKLAELIKKNGVKEKFTLRGKTRWYLYLYLGGYKYWTIMDVMNRCKAVRPIDREVENFLRLRDIRWLRDSKG